MLKAKFKPAVDLSSTCPVGRMMWQVIALDFHTRCVRKVVAMRLLHHPNHVLLQHRSLMKPRAIEIRARISSN